MNKLVRITITLILLPFLYLSGVRLVSQFIVSTDNSTLFDTALATITSNPQSFSLDRPISLVASLEPFQLKTQNSKLKTLAALDSANADNYYLLAQSYLAAGEMTLASRMCRHSLQLATVDPKNWLLFGWTDGLGGSIEQGYTAFDRAVMLDPKRADSLAQQGMYLYQLSRASDGSRKSLYSTLSLFNLNAALDLDAALYRNPEFNTTIASLYASLGQPGYAISCITKIGSNAVIAWPLLIRRAVLLFDLGESVKAISLWERQFDPKGLSVVGATELEREINRYNVCELSYFLAQIHIAQGKHDQALKELRDLVSKKPTFAEYKMALAGEFEYAGKTKEASRLYEEALKLSPSNQEAKKKVLEYYRKRRES